MRTHQPTRSQQPRVWVRQSARQRYLRLGMMWKLVAVALLVAGPRAAAAQELIDLRLPRTIELRIPPSTPTGVYPRIDIIDLHRDPPRPGFPVVVGGAGMTYQDQDWQFDTRYRYWLSGTSSDYRRHPVTGEPVIDPATGQYIIDTWGWESPGIHVTVRKVPVQDNQSVDARIDKRYGNNPPVPVNYKFKTKTYRGGLFAGFAAPPDGSGVGRSYLKFALDAPEAGPIQAGEKLWPFGGLCVYFTRMDEDGTMRVTCRGAASDAWDPMELVWGNAPAPVAYGGGHTTVAYSSTSGEPQGRWVTVNALPDIERELDGDKTLTLVLQGASETQNGWGYFAKKEYTEGSLGNLGAYLLYAWGGQGASLSGLQLAPNSVVGGSETSTGTVSLGFAAPDGGMTVQLSSSNPQAATVPGTVWVAPGDSTASFNVTTFAVSANTSVVITATLGGSKTATLTVRPNN